MGKSLLILGAGGHGRVIEETAIAVKDEKEENVYGKIDFLDDQSERAVGRLSDLDTRSRVMMKYSAGSGTIKSGNRFRKGGSKWICDPGINSSAGVCKSFRIDRKRVDHRARGAGKCKCCDRRRLHPISRFNRRSRCDGGSVCTCECRGGMQGRKQSRERAEDRCRCDCRK